MSYAYDQYSDRFVKVDDETPTSAWGGTTPNITSIPVCAYPVIYIPDDCIERIADAVVRKMREREADNETD